MSTLEITLLITLALAVVLLSYLGYKLEDKTKRFSRAEEELTTLRRTYESLLARHHDLLDGMRDISTGLDESLAKSTASIKTRGESETRMARHAAHAEMHRPVYYPENGNPSTILASLAAGGVLGAVAAEVADEVMDVADTVYSEELTPSEAVDVVCEELVEELEEFLGLDDEENA